MIVVVFLAGLIIGTIIGMLSWLAAAAYLESKRKHLEDSEYTRPVVFATAPAAKPVNSRVRRRMFRDHRSALSVAPETKRETTRPSASH